MPCIVREQCGTDVINSLNASWKRVIKLVCLNCAFVPTGDSSRPHHFLSLTTKWCHFYPVAVFILCYAALEAPLSSLIYGDGLRKHGRFLKQWKLFAA